MFFGLGTVGIIVVIGIITHIYRMISEPKKVTQRKINELEKEIKDLKAKVLSCLYWAHL